MSARDILIVYGTSYGQTEKIARRMAEWLRESGDRVVLANADEIPYDLDVADFDGVLIGGSVLFGRHKASLRKFVRAERRALGRLPSGFFSVSGAAASRDPHERRRASAFLDQFAQRTGWQPTLSLSVAGAMSYTKYHPLVRWMLRRISRAEGGPTDTSRDHEMTDWTQVRRFVDAFVTLVDRHPASPRPHVAVEQRLTSGVATG